MSLDGSPKAKAVYEQYFQKTFKQEWGIPQVYSFSPGAFFGWAKFTHLESAKYCL